MEDKKILADVGEAVLEGLAKPAKPDDTTMDKVENVAVSLIEKLFDPAFEAGLEALKKAIPGEQFDGIATLFIQHFQPAAKAKSLELADLIDKKVG